MQSRSTQDCQGITQLQRRMQIFWNRQRADGMTNSEGVASHQCDTSIMRDLWRFSLPPCHTVILITWQDPVFSLCNDKIIVIKKVSINHDLHVNSYILYCYLQVGVAFTLCYFILLKLLRHYEGLCCDRPRLPCDHILCVWELIFEAGLCFY